MPIIHTIKRKQRRIKGNVLVKMYKINEIIQILLEYILKYQTNGTIIQLKWLYGKAIDKMFHGSIDPDMGRLILTFWG